MTSISLSSHKLDSELLCPTSKSYANRALILAAIDKRPILIKDLPHSEDVEFMIDGLVGLGINVLKKNNDVEIIGCIDDVKSGCSVYLGEGGTTIRFFMALVSLLSVPVKLKVHPRFLKRPINEYIKLLNSLAVKVELGEDFILVQGPIFKGQKIEVDCSKSTQFASALELISEKANLDVIAVNLVASGGYFKMTKKVLEDLSESTTYHVPVDYSSFGYFAVFAALTTPVTVTNAHVIDPLQGDSQILEFIKRMGGDFKFTSKGVVISPIKESNSIIVDGSSCIDLVPTLMVLMGLSGKEQKITNIKNLQYKECDRLEQMQKILSHFEVPFSYDENSDVFTIQGIIPKTKYIKIETAHDHRMVMCAAMMVKMFGGGEVAPVEACAKSFGNFFEYFR